MSQPSRPRDARHSSASSVAMSSSSDRFRLRHAVSWRRWWRRSADKRRSLRATPTNADLGTVTVSENTSATIDTMAPITSVSELTPASSFGGDIVTIAAGPGGVFGNAIYAISRGAGDNTADGA